MKRSTISGLERAFRLLGAGLATRRLRGGDPATRRRAAYHVQERLGHLHGLPQKVGQILSMSPDSETRAAFTPLRNGGPALELDELLGPLSDAWDADPFEVCSNIEGAGLAASLGQVHRAILRDGREVAIKIRYPGIHGAIEGDLRALGWLSVPVGNLRRGFDLDAYRTVVQGGLEQELDYRAEARNQADVSRAARGTNLVVPGVVRELSTDGVLTTLWEEGQSLEEACTWEAPLRAELGRSLVRTFLELAFDHSLVHADPHPGNYAFRSTAAGVQVVLYDYGCVHRLSDRERLALLDLLRGAIERDPACDPYPLLVELGFDADLLRPLRHKLAALCAVLFEPFASSGTYDLSTWNRAARVAGVLGEDRLNFRTAGAPRLLFFLRAFEGLCFYLRELGQPVLWSKPLRALLARHAEALAAFEPAEPADPSTTFDCLATSLVISVTDAGRSKARITLPAGAVERLGDFIDPNLDEKIRARGIVVERLIEGVRERRYAPQEVFALQDGERRIEIRLE